MRFGHGVLIASILGVNSACTLTRPTSPSLSVARYANVQQSLDYTCGPAAAVAFAKFYRIEADELEASTAMGTNPGTGTRPEAMAHWLQSKGLHVLWGENGTLDLLKTNLQNGKPTLVEWVDWGGHWAAVVGFDDKGTRSTQDDELILADTYDRLDGQLDGLTSFNAERFDAMWFDALNFGRVMRRIYLYVQD